jgi:hypothetical protein
MDFCMDECMVKDSEFLVQDCGEKGKQVYEKEKKIS